MHLGSPTPIGGYVEEHSYQQRDLFTGKQFSGIETNYSFDLDAEVAGIAFDSTTNGRGEHTTDMAGSIGPFTAQVSKNQVMAGISLELPFAGPVERGFLGINGGSTQSVILSQRMLDSMGGIEGLQAQFGDSGKISKIDSLANFDTPTSCWYGYGLLASQHRKDSNTESLP